MTVATTIFIAKYCDLFDWFGLLAKKRLLDYPVATFVTTPFFFWISAYSCRKYSSNSSGHGLQSVLQILEKSPNNFDKASFFLSARIIIVKAVSSLIATFGGGALGKEGPSVQMSAEIFAVISHKYRKFLPKINLETWVFAGSAAGLTVVFGAPIAGVVFIIEKLSKKKFRNFKSNISWTLIIVAIVTMVLHELDPIFIFQHKNFFTLDNAMPLVLTAIICGSVAFVFKKISHSSYLKISSIKTNWWHAVPIGAGLVVACISFYSGIYSFSGGIDTMQKALSGEIILSAPEVVGRILNTIITFLAGCAGGLIAPAMTIGTGIGSVVGVISSPADIGIFLLVGMAAFLSVVLGEFLTAAVIVFEVVGRDVKTIPFLLFAVIVAASTVKVIEIVFAKRGDDKVSGV